MSLEKFSHRAAYGDVRYRLLQLSKKEIEMALKSWKWLRSTTASGQTRGSAFP